MSDQKRQMTAEELIAQRKEQEDAAKAPKAPAPQTSKGDGR